MILEKGTSGEELTPRFPRVPSTVPFICQRNKPLNQKGMGDRPRAPNQGARPKAASSARGASEASSVAGSGRAQLLEPCEAEEKNRPKEREKPAGHPTRSFCPQGKGAARQKATPTKGTSKKERS